MLLTIWIMGFFVVGFFSFLFFLLGFFFWGGGRGGIYQQCMKTKMIVHI